MNERHSRTTFVYFYPFFIAAILLFIINRLFWKFMSLSVAETESIKFLTMNMKIYKEIVHDIDAARLCIYEPYDTAGQCCQYFRLNLNFVLLLLLQKHA